MQCLLQLEGALVLSGVFFSPSCHTQLRLCSDLVDSDDQLTFLITPSSFGTGVDVMGFNPGSSVIMSQLREVLFSFLDRLELKMEGEDRLKKAETLFLLGIMGEQVL